MGTSVFGLCVGMPWVERPPADAAVHPVPRFSKGSIELAIYSAVYGDPGVHLANPSIGTLITCHWKKANPHLYLKSIQEMASVTQ